MKLLRYGPAGSEKPGLLDGQGQIRDLSYQLDQLTNEHLTPTALTQLQQLDVAQLPVVKGNPRLGVPYLGVGKFVAIGLNYSDHAQESQLPIPAEPIVFNKWTSCISGPNDGILLPRGSQKTDWEVELGVVIGSVTRYVEQAQALHHVAGYCVVNDVSERNYQLERGSQWDRGKGCDSFGPIGPYLVTQDEVPDPQALDLWLDLNGKPMQRGNTSKMIFSVAYLVSYLSQFMTLYPGDLITTGTPPGVGMAKTPPRFLKEGDELRLGIKGLGEQTQKVRSQRSSSV